MNALKNDTRIELHKEDDAYPKTLLDLPDPPEVLYVRGDPTILSARCFSIIGARKATPYGLSVSELAGRVCAESGLVVVSGGAIGCDQAGGWGALNAGGKHICVLGGSADVIYPKSAAGLVARTIETGGAVVSLLPWGVEALPWSFPKRNRVIAALSQAVFIAEAGEPSGTFSTAEAAMDLGREVLAVPGSIMSPESRGTNGLIANGATCIVDAESIELAISRIYGTLRKQSYASPGVVGLNPSETKTLAALTADPMRADAVANMLGLDALGVVKHLSSMEMAGLVQRLPDGRYAPTKFSLKAQTAFATIKR